MLQDARTVFYRSNRVVILPPPTSHVVPYAPVTAPFGSSLLFNRLRPSSLVHLRELELILSGDRYGRMGIDVEQVVRDEWVRVLQHVKRLSLTLYLGYESEPGVFKDGTHDLSTSLSQLFRVHEQLVRPLQEVNGLEMFFVYAASPYEYYDLQGESRVYADTQLQKDLQKHEKKLESIVMGELYDSIAVGKLGRRYSRWLTERYAY